MDMRKRQALSLLGLMLVFLTCLANPSVAGVIFDARCDCGYERTHLFLFGGKADFETVCMFPGLCRATGELVLFNILRPSEPVDRCRDGKIVPYDSPELLPDHPGEPISSWNVPTIHKSFQIFEGGYYCPQCQRKKLTFFSRGLWD